MDHSKKTFSMILGLLILLLAALTMTQGCKEKPQTSNPVETAGKVVASVGTEQKTCPIMKGNPINKDLFTEYMGKKVYFCCPGCETKFKANPERYLSQPPQFDK